MAKDAARLETGSVWRDLCAFCKGHDNKLEGTGRTLISYAVRNNVERCPEERSDGGKERTR